MQWRHKIRYNSKFSTDHFQIFTEVVKLILISQEGMPKMRATVFSYLRSWTGWEAFFAPHPVNDGLTVASTGEMHLPEFFYVATETRGLRGNFAERMGILCTTSGSEKLTGSGPVTELQRHKWNNLRPIFHRNHFFSQVTCCPWLECKHHAGLIIGLSFARTCFSAVSRKRTYRSERKLGTGCFNMRAIFS